MSTSKLGHHKEDRRISNSDDKIKTSHYDIRWSSVVAPAREDSNTDMVLDILQDTCLRDGCEKGFRRRIAELLCPVGDSRTDAFSSVTVCIWEIRDGCSPGNWFKCLVGRRGCRRAFNQRSFKLKCWLNLWLNRQSYGTPGWSKVSYFEFCLSKFSISW